MKEGNKFNLEAMKPAGVMKGREREGQKNGSFCCVSC
jgi:hypothetical protein